MSAPAFPTPVALAGPSVATLRALDSLPGFTSLQTFGVHVFAVLTPNHYVIVGPELDDQPEWLDALLDGANNDWSAETHDNGVTSIVHLTRRGLEN